MTTRYFIDASGKYLGAFVSGAKPPTAGVEVDSPPEDARQLWTGSEWVDPDQVVRAFIAAERYKRELAGVVVGGMGIDTDDRSKTLINGAALKAMRNSSYILNWKTPGGFVQIPADQVLAMADAVSDHVQACFDRESELLDALADGAFTPEMLDHGWPA